MAPVCEQHDDLKSEISNIRKCLREIKDALLGTLTEKGLVSEVRENTEYRTKQTNTKNGLADWAFRCVLTVVIGYIAVKVGLK